MNIHTPLAAILAKKLLAAALGLLLASASARSAERIDDHPLTEAKILSTLSSPSQSRSWALAFDNDVLVPGSRDQDYTYGLSLNISGDQTLKHWLSGHGILEKIDGIFSLHDTGVTHHKIEYGLFGFTPEDIQTAAPINDDRPYASLVYVSSTTERYNPQSESSWTSAVTLGALGLPIVGELQQEVHEWTDGNQPLGWKNQISDGGELTARYSLAHQKLLLQTDDGLEFKRSYQASLGYLTEASVSFSGRYGKIHTPWLSFNPELSNYGEKSAPSGGAKINEHYAWAGISLKGRAYNAFLEGQFRDSEVSYDSSELDHVVIEAWAGYTFSTDHGYRFTYSLRGHTSELKSGTGDRNILWGGVQIARII